VVDGRDDGRAAGVRDRRGGYGPVAVGRAC